ncbi:MAG: Flagellar P-ring protein precursor [Pseudomonadota bacterium]|jgi:flagellar P-ring protein precursor FlgI
MKNLATFLFLVMVLLGAGAAKADRVKDLTSVASQRSNQLVGFGLVVGLPGTGDDAAVPFTTQSLKSMLSQLGVRIDGPLSDFEKAQAASQVDIKNTAAVMVTAELPGFAKPGQKIDVNVAALGKASNLRGGNLILTALRGVDGEIYALAQGQLASTTIEAGAAGSKVTVGVPTAARIPNGAMVERMVQTPFETADQVVLNLRENDFSTASAIVKAIDQNFGQGTANAIDGTSVSVRAPKDLNQRVAFLGALENLQVTPAEAPARVVVNSRTGTVVINGNVRVTPSAIAQGSITVSISATNEVSQPNPFAQGTTTPVQNANIAVNEAKNPMFLFKPGVELRDIVDAINQVGASPSTLIAILEALKSAGSLRADLVVI